MDDKPIIWIGSARDDVRDFPEDARRKAGFELRAVQRGALPSDFKPMHSVGQGVYEIRIRTGDAFRVFYVAKFDEAVYVLHAFQKKTQKTSRKDIEQGRQSYRTMLHYREQHQRGSPWTSRREATTYLKIWASIRKKRRTSRFGRT